ncbi:MAG TPA: lipid-A-disaccharide synthase N-terminal domain-containing protein [Thermoanaerobaculales bacterium]|nr:lipid-A-disaccharide synthase N-terminal domain-containing protein [Thermoanaerobaculales bacterium]
MRRHRTLSPRIWLAVAAALAATLLSASLQLPAQGPPPTEPGAASPSSVKMELKPLPEGVDRVRLEADGAGGHWYVLELSGGGEERVRPDELAARVERDQRSRGFWFRLLNISSPIGFAWVAMGLLGQVLFTGRMLLQWLVSERSKRSVVPVGFWWLSLVGASMLLVYFIWRRDIVGVLGQCAGWVVYGRNLWLIRRERRLHAAAAT